MDILVQRLVPFTIGAIIAAVIAAGLGYTDWADALMVTFAVGALLFVGGGILVILLEDVIQ